MFGSRLIKLLTCASLLATPSISWPAERATIWASAITMGQVDVDGHAEEPAWTDASWFSDFVQRSPFEGSEPTERTRVAVLYDEHALYVFVEALDRSPERIRARLTRRDQDSASDWIEIWLAPQRDRRAGYRFAVNPLGVRIDTRLSDAGEHQDRDWNGIWQVASRRTSVGWCAEFRIPFRQLRFEQPDVPWGLNVARKLARTHEEVVLAPTPKSALRPLHYTAALEGLSRVERTRRAELIPQLSLQYHRDGMGSTFRPQFGGDAIVGLGTSRTLQMTVFPEFGQVQSDPSQLNLTAFEVFLPEKRPFFLEGREVFRFALAFRGKPNESLFYSRRIGAKPSLSAGVEESQLLEYPSHTTILGAARLIGREANGLGYGLLAATTAGATATVLRGGQPQSVPVAAPTEFVVARIRKEIVHAHAAIGGMVTFTGRRLEGELRNALVSQAVAAATDLDLRRGDYGLVASLLGTNLSGTAAAINAVQRSATQYFQRPDAHHVSYDPTRTSLTGWGAEVVGGKLDGAPWRATWGVRARSPGLNPNDLGYLQRADQQTAELSVQRREDTPGRWHRYYHLTTNAWLNKTFGPEVTGAGAGMSGYWQLPDHSATYAGLRRHLAALDVTLLRGGPAFLLPGRWEGWWGVGTDERRDIDVDFDLSGEARDDDSLTRGSASVALNVHPTSSLRISMVPSFERSVDSLQYVSNDPTYGIVLGRLHRNTVSTTFHASWAITPTLSFEAYAMPYFTAGIYRGFFGVRNPRAPRLLDRLGETAHSANERFSLGQLRSNLVLKWEYSPGSTAFLVWIHEQTQSGQEFGTVRIDRDLPSLVSARPLDVVLLKLSHYLGL